MIRWRPLFVAQDILDSTAPGGASWGGDSLGLSVRDTLGLGRNCTPGRNSWTPASHASTATFLLLVCYIFERRGTGGFEARDNRSPPPGCNKLENNPVAQADMEFVAFVREHQDMVYSTALRLVGSPQEAEDIAQDTFIKAWRGFDKLSENSQAGGWLRTVARNASISHIVRHRKRFIFFSALANEDGEVRIADVAPPQDDDAWLHEKLDAIRRALPELPQSFRAPLVLYHYEDMSYEQIAAALKISVAKVKSDIFRGRAKLRAALESMEVAHA